MTVYCSLCLLQGLYPIVLIRQDIIIIVITIFDTLLEI